MKCIPYLEKPGFPMEAFGNDEKRFAVVLAGFVPESTTKLRVFSYGYSMVEVNNVAITAGQTTENIVITLPSPTMGIKGVVSSHDAVGLPIADAFVVMAGENGYGITTTDSNGNFAIQGLQEGVSSPFLVEIR